MPGSLSGVAPFVPQTPFFPCPFAAGLQLSALWNRLADLWGQEWWHRLGGVLSFAQGWVSRNHTSSPPYCWEGGRRDTFQGANEAVCAKKISCSLV